MGNTKVATFEIDSEKAEVAVQRMQKLMQLMNKTAEEARKELSQIFVDVHGQLGAPLDKTKQKVEDNTKSLRDFRQEQRMQNFVLREGSQAMMSLLFAYAYLQQGQDKTTGTTKKITDALLTGFMAANATQFAFFTLGQVGEKMGGKVGAALSKVGSYGGEIGIVVGTIIAAKQVFDELMRSADRFATRDLKFFGERTPKLSLEALLEERRKVMTEIKSIVDSSPLKSMMRALVTGDYATFTIAVQNEQKLFSLREKEKVLNEAVAERSKVQLGTIEAINIQIAELVAKRDLEAKSMQEAAKYTDQIVKLEQEKARLLKTSREIRLAEAAIALSVLEAGTKAEPDQFRRQQLEAQLELQKELAQIEENRKKAILEGGNREWINAKAREQSEKARLAYAWKADEIYYTREHDLALLKAENLANNVRQVEARYDAEEDFVRRTVKDEELRREKLFALRRQRETELADLEIRTLSELAQGFQAIEQGLTSIGVKADSTLSRMIQMAQIALRIAQLVNAMNVRPEGATTADYLSIFGNILGFIGLFDTGGWTGPGSRNQIAGYVHKDEIVFEQPLVQRYRNELLGLRRSMQMGIPTTGMFPTADNGNLNTAILVNELRSLKQVVRTLEIQVPVIFRNVLNAQKIVREQLPAAQQYYSKKSVDPTS
jgi:hypothetical protein